MRESKYLKHLKTFESFSTNEGKITDRIKDAFKSKSTKEKEKKEADLKSEYDKLLRELYVKEDLVELLEYIQDMVTTGKALDSYDSERLINKKTDLEKGGRFNHIHPDTTFELGGDDFYQEIGYYGLTDNEVVTTKQKIQIDNKLKSVMGEVKDLEEKLRNLEKTISPD